LGRRIRISEVAVAVATARWTLISLQEAEVAAEVVQKYQLKVPPRAFPIEQSEL
jgi:hypothetical protein